MVFFYKTCSLLLGVLEQPRVYNSSAGSLKHRPQLGTISPIGLKPVLCLREENTLPDLKQVSPAIHSVPPSGKILPIGLSCNLPTDIITRI
jgi:hypothetical protein